MSRSAFAGPLQVPLKILLVVVNMPLPWYFRVESGIGGPGPFGGCFAGFWTSNVASNVVPFRRTALSPVLVFFAF